MAWMNTFELISIANANKLGLSALAREAEEGRERILIRNNKPVAAVVGMDRIERWQHVEDDLLDIALVAARMATAGPERYSLDEVLAESGYTRDQLRAIPD